jgi:hypothetical protein
VNEPDDRTANQVDKTVSRRNSDLSAEKATLELNQ